MANNIGKILLYTQILETKDPNLLAVLDFSKWRVIEEMPAYIEITLPGSNKPIVLPFNKNEVNWYNSLSLGLNCHVDCEDDIIPLPDGVYEINIRGGKDGERNFRRYHLKKDTLQSDLNKAWLKLGLEYELHNKEIRDRLLYVVGFLNSAQSATEEGEIARARDFFKLAEKSLEDFKQCKDCI